MKKPLMVVLVLIGLVTHSQTVFYVSQTGNDNNTGTSGSSPWKTIAKVNSARLRDGDKVLFQGGQAFQGSVIASVSGVTYSSYGGSKATIQSGNDNGITLHEVERVSVLSLIFQGNGYRVTPRTASGIHLETTNGTRNHLRGVTIDSVECFGYRGRGIYVSSTSDFGYRQLSILNSSCHDNGMAGIEAIGKWANNRSVRSHVIRVAYSEAYNNHGWNDYNTNWSGSGIVLGGVDSTVIEYSKAHHNGSENANWSRGPIGIWFWDAINSVIRHCESYENIASTKTDGGGFDLDGGCENTVIEYCKSWNNDGAGYGLYEWGSEWTYTNNAIRNCESRNDARKNNYGALSLWGVDWEHQVTNSVVENNVFFVNQGSGVKLMGSNFTNVKVRNNVFYLANATLTHIDGSADGVTFIDNTFTTDVLAVKAGSLKVTYDKETNEFTATFVSYSTTSTQYFTLEYSTNGSTWQTLQTVKPERLEAEKKYTLKFKLKP
jgi:hypothetical protein